MKPKFYVFILGVICFNFATLQAQVANGNTICYGDSTFVYANNNPSVTYEWYDALVGGNLLGTGDTLWTGGLTSSTTYYLKIIDISSVQYNVGPLNNTIAGGSNYTYFPDGLVFSVASAVTIDTVFVYPNGPGNVTVNIYNSGLTLIHTVTVPVTTTTKTPIPIDYAIAPGTGYRIDAQGTTTGGLFRNTGGATYPYTSAPLNITGAINGSTTFYYFFYDWKLHEGPAPTWDSATVTINPLPNVNLGNDTLLCPGSGLSFSEPVGESYVWSTGQTGSVTFDTAGVYSLTSTDMNGCSAMDTISLFFVSFDPGLPDNGGFCVGGTWSFCVGGLPGMTYNWSTTGTSACDSIMSPGNISVICTDTNGCVFMDTTNVISMDIPVASMQVDTSNCPDLSFLDLSTGSPDTWSWDFGDGGTSNVQNPNYTYANNGNYTIMLIAENMCGSDTISQSIYVNCVIGLDNVEASISSLIYPNPGNGHFNINVNVTGEICMEVMDLLGHRILIRKVNVDAGSVLPVDISGLSSGIYHVKLTYENKVQTFRYVLK